MQITERINPFTLEPVVRAIEKNLTKAEKRDLRLVCKIWCRIFSEKDLRSAKKVVFNTQEISVEIFCFFSTQELSKMKLVCSTFKKSIEDEYLLGDLEAFEKDKVRGLTHIPLGRYFGPYLSGIYNKGIDGAEVAKKGTLVAFATAVATIPTTIITNIKTVSTHEIPIKYLPAFKAWTQEVAADTGKYLWKFTVMKDQQVFKLVEYAEPTNLNTIYYKLFSNEGKILMGIAGVAGLAALVANRASIYNFFFSHTDQTKQLVEDRVSVKIPDETLEKFSIDKRFLPKFPVICKCDMEVGKESTKFDLDSNNDIVGDQGGHLIELDTAKANLRSKKCSYLGLSVGKKNVEPLVAYLARVNT